jgi:hypothetical protein
MTDDTPSVKRVLLVRTRAPTPDAAALMASMAASARPFYEAFGKARLRLLHNVDDRSEFVQLIEYESDQALELSRHNIASDPRFQMWRSLFGGALDIAVYEEDAPAGGEGVTTP